MKTKNIIGIFHSRDLDGYASGAIIKHKYPDAEFEISKLAIYQAFKNQFKTSENG